MTDEIFNSWLMTRGCFIGVLPLLEVLLSENKVARLDLDSKWVRIFSISWYIQPETPLFDLILFSGRDFYSLAYLLLLCLFATGESGGSIWLFYCLSYKLSNLVSKQWACAVKTVHIGRLLITGDFVLLELKVAVCLLFLSIKDFWVFLLCLITPWSLSYITVKP